MHQDATCYGGRPQPRRLCVRWRPSPSPKSGRSSQFSAHVYCGRTVGWIKTALSMEVGLSPGDIVLDGDPDPLPKNGAEPPVFVPFLLWPNGWMHEDATWYEGRRQTRGLWVRWGPSPHPKKEMEAGGSVPQIFGPWLQWPNGWMDQDGTWQGGRPWSSPHCARWGHSSPP